MREVFLSIIIPARSDSRTLRSVVESLLAQQCRVGVEIIVVANPIRWSYETLFPSVRFFQTSPAGVNRARNRGIEKSRGEWLYFLDDDCRLARRDHLQALADKLMNSPKNVIWGGPYVHNGISRWSQAYHILQSRWLAEGYHPQIGDMHLLGGNLALHRSVIEKYRFDENISFGEAEKELLNRLWHHGFRGHLDYELAIYHDHMLSRADLVRKALLQGYYSERHRSQCLDLLPRRKSFIYQQEAKRLRRELKTYEDAFAFGGICFREGLAADIHKIELRYSHERFKRWWKHPSAHCTALLRFLRAIHEN